MESFRGTEEGLHTSYFCHNNIELDVIRLCFFSNVRGRAASADWIRRSSMSGYVSDAILRKCVRNEFLVRRTLDEYLVTFKGMEAFLSVVAEITKRLAASRKDSQAIAKEMHQEGVCFGGQNQISRHYRLVEAILQDLVWARVADVRDGHYGLRPIDERERRIGELIVGLLSQLMLRRRDRLDNLLLAFKKAFHLDALSVRSLIDLARRNGHSNLVSFFEHSDRGDPLIEELIDDGRRDALQEDDKLKEAGLACLKAHFADNERVRDKLYSEAWIGLAVFCKRNRLVSRAKEFYQKAYEVLRKYPELGNSAMRQLANFLDCDRRIRLEKGDYQGAIQSCSEQESIWDKLGMPRQKAYCQCMKLEIQSYAAEQMGNYLRSSELWLQCSNLASTFYRERAVSHSAMSAEMEGRHFERLGDDVEASKCFERASSQYAKINDHHRANATLGMSHQFRAMGYKADATHSFEEIASEFWLAKEKYELAGFVEAAKVCEGDYHKYKGLYARQNGNYDEAIKHFQDGCLIEAQIAQLFPMRASRHLASAKWFDGTILETEVERDILTLIPKRHSLDQCIGKLRRAGNSFSNIGAEQCARIDYCLSIILMAVDHFHAGRISESNRVLSGAKHELPPDFSFVLFEDQVSDGWQPLRYTVSIIEEFNRYSRKIETEKGFSFESRVREILRREYCSYDDIESRSFSPEDDEVGIVFPDKTPIEIDALGIRQAQTKMRLLVGEIRNQNEPVDFSALVRLRKKAEFLKVRYSKIARLQSLSGAEVETLLFVSRSGFALGEAGKTQPIDVLLIDKHEIDKMMKKHGLRAMP